MYLSVKLRKNPRPYPFLSIHYNLDTCSQSHKQRNATEISFTFLIKKWVVIVLNVYVLNIDCSCKFKSSLKHTGYSEDFVKHYTVPSSAWVFAQGSTLHYVMREYVDSHGDRHQQRHNDKHEHDQVVGVLKIGPVSENVNHS